MFKPRHIAICAIGIIALPLFYARAQGVSDSKKYIIKKLDQIVIPKIEFKDVTIREAIDYLHKQSVELDTARKGVNIILKLPSAHEAVAPAASADEAKITVTLSNIPLSEALRYISSLAGLQVELKPDEVWIVPIPPPDNRIITKVYKVPPAFAVPKQMTVRKFLEGSGVQFPDGASVDFSHSNRKLVVRDTQDNIDLVSMIVDDSQYWPPPPTPVSSGTEDKK